MSLLDAPVTDEVKDAPPVPDGGTPPASGNREWVAEEYRNEKCLESVPDVKTLQKNYVESQKYIGGAIKIPKDDATPDEWAKFHEKLGRPAKAEDYKFDPKGLPQGMQYDEARLTAFRQKAHELGITQKQAEGLFGWYNADVGAHFANTEKGKQAAISGLKDEWGPTFDRNVSLAQRAVKEYGDETTKAMLDETGLGNDPRVIKLFARIGMALGEDKVISNGPGAIMNEKSAQQKITAIMSDQKHAYFDKANPGHDAAVKEVEALYRLAYDKP